MSISEYFIAWVQQLVHTNIQLSQSIQPIIMGIQQTANDNTQLRNLVSQLNIVINMQDQQLRSLQEENVSLQRSVSTATIELEKLQLQLHDPKDDVDTEAETVILYRRRN